MPACRAFDWLAIRIPDRSSRTQLNMTRHFHLRHSRLVLLAMPLLEPYALLACELRGVLVLAPLLAALPGGGDTNRVVVASTLSGDLPAPLWAGYPLLRSAAFGEDSR